MNNISGWREGEIIVRRRLLRRGKWMGVTAIVTLTLVAVAAGSFVPLSASNPQTREITLEARRFAYSPERIEVNKGDRVVLTVASQDVTHGVYVDGYGVKSEAAPGEDAVIEFVADKPGTFRIRCPVNCGELHPFMIGLLTVRPNSPFVGAAMAVLLIGLGATALGWSLRGRDGA